MANAAPGVPIPPVDLSGRRILVTGGTAGAGRAFVAAFRAAGAAVGVLSRDAARLAEVVDATGAVGRVADVGDHDAAATAVGEIVEALGTSTGSSTTLASWCTARHPPGGTMTGTRWSRPTCSG